MQRTSRPKAGTTLQSTTLFLAVRQALQIFATAASSLWPHARAASDVTTAAWTDEFGDSIDNWTGYQYQIPGLTPALQYYVRVSAINAAGGVVQVGPATSTTPATHSPVAQIPGVPEAKSSDGNWNTQMSIQVSQLDVPSHLHVSWVRPHRNDLGFLTADGGAEVTHYRLEYDTADTFSAPAHYDFATRADDNTLLDCAAGSACTFELGAEVQVIRISADATTSITAGQFKLSWTGSDNVLRGTSCLTATTGAEPASGLMRSSLKTHTDVPCTTEYGADCGDLQVSRVPLSPRVGVEYRIAFVGKIPSESIVDVEAVVAELEHESERRVKKLKIGRASCRERV